MRQTIEHILQGKPYDFVSPYTLGEIHQRLNKLSERDKQEPSTWNPKTNLLLITQETLDKTSYKFHADKDLGRNLLITSDGIVKAESSGVRITGRVHIGSFTLGFLGIWSIVVTVIGIFFLISPRPNIGIWNFLPLFGLLIAGSLLYTCKKGQDELYQQFHDTLAKFKKKKTPKQNTPIA